MVREPIDRFLAARHHVLQPSFPLVVTLHPPRRLRRVEEDPKFLHHERSVVRRGLAQPSHLLEPRRDERGSLLVPAEPCEAAADIAPRSRE